MSIHEPTILASATRCFCFTAKELIGEFGAAVRRAGYSSTREFFEQHPDVTVEEARNILAEEAK